MRIFFVLFLCFKSVALAESCPNVSGLYAENVLVDGVLEIKQDGCTSFYEARRFITRTGEVGSATQEFSHVMNGKNPCPEEDTYDQYPDVLTKCKAVGFTKDVVTFESRVGWVVVDDPKHGQCYFYSMLLGLDKNQDLVKLIPLTCADGHQFVTGTTYTRLRK